jgi:hypothetical protein
MREGTGSFAHPLFLARPFSSGRRYVGGFVEQRNSVVAGYVGQVLTKHVDPVAVGSSGMCGMNPAVYLPVLSCDFVNSCSACDGFSSSSWQIVQFWLSGRLVST